MKQKFISLALAVMLLLGVTGCAMSTPASVGSIGGVDIPAGIYLNLLAQCLDHTVQVMFVLTDDLDRMAVVQTHHTENALCISNAALHVMHADLIVTLGSGRHDSLYFCEVGNLDLSYHNNDLHK